MPRRTGRRLSADHEGLLELLVDARLLTSDDGIVELAHEALARAWPRLRGWLEDDVEGQRILRHVTGAADAWDLMGRPDTELYRGTRLTQALDWEEHARADLTATERAFLDAGRQRAQEERRAAEDQFRRQRRSRRRLRGLAAGIAVLLLVSVAASLIAVRQGERADAARLSAASRRAAALSLGAEDVTRALLLGAQSLQLHDSPDGRASLLAALTRSPALIAAVPGDFTTDVAVSPDGEQLAVGDGLGSIWFHDAETLDYQGSHGTQPLRLAYRPDGRRLAVVTTTWRGPAPSGSVFLRFLDPITRRRVEPIQVGGFPDAPSEVSDLDYSADGPAPPRDRRPHHRRHVGERGPCVGCRRARPSHAAPGLPGRVWAASLSPDGRVAYVGCTTRRQSPSTTSPPAARCARPRWGRRWQRGRRPVARPTVWT